MVVLLRDGVKIKSQTVQAHLKVEFRLSETPFRLITNESQNHKVVVLLRYGIENRITHRPSTSQKWSFVSATRNFASSHTKRPITKWAFCFGVTPKLHNRPSNVRLLFIASGKTITEENT